MLNNIAAIMGGALAVGDYESIATTTVGSGGTSTITFSSIPSTYKHLQIRSISRVTSSAAGSTVSYGASALLRFNSDSSSNYWWHYVLGDGSSASAGNSGSATTSLYVSDMAGPWATQTANTFSSSVVDILDYSLTTKNKTLRALTGQDRNGYGRVVFNSGSWSNSTIQAINSITMTTDGTSFAQYSSFALYGIK